VNAVVISLDAELAWGFHDHEELPQARVAAARDGWQWLLDQFETRSIPATWAVVGHLMLAECDGRHEYHPATEGWFERDPGGDEHRSPRWFGRSLVEAIVDSGPDHEIGSHTFSHPEFGASETTRDAADAEVRRAMAVTAEWDLSLSSFVFPRNNLGHRDVLAEHGVDCYRGRAPDRWYDDAPLRPLGKAVSYAAGRTPPPIVRPRIDSRGLVEIPASLYLFSFEGLAGDALRRVRGDPVVRRVERGLEALRDQAGLLHLWLHPNNLQTAADRRRIERVLDLIATHRERTGTEVITMREVADTVRQHG